MNTIEGLVHRKWKCHPCTSHPDLWKHFPMHVTLEFHRGKEFHQMEAPCGQVRQYEKETKTCLQTARVASSKRPEDAALQFVLNWPHQHQCFWPKYQPYQPGVTFMWLLWLLRMSVSLHATGTFYSRWTIPLSYFHLNNTCGIKTEKLLPLLKKNSARICDFPTLDSDSVAVSAHSAFMTLFNQWRSLILS